LGASVWLTGEVVLGLPTLGGGWGWVWGALLVWGGPGPGHGVSTLLALWFMHWVSI